MSADVECRVCTSQTQDDCDACGGNGYFECCRRCGDPMIARCSWSGSCLDCHEAGLLPESAWDRREAFYAV